MTIGEIVEAMIYIRDRSVVMRSDKDALADACNILDELPSNWTVEEARTLIRSAQDNASMAVKERLK